LVKRYAALLAFLLSTPVCGALSGVTELAGPPEKLTDAQLTALLRPRIARADVIAIGETIHGSSAFLRVQTRLIQHLVTQHGMRLIAWETAVLRGLELSRWVSDCKAARTPVPIGGLYGPTVSDLPLFEWICDYNRSHPADPIVFRGMDVWDRPWEHYARIASLGERAGIEARLLADARKSCPARDASSWNDVSLVQADVARDRQFLPAAAYARCRAALTAILESARQAGLAKRTTDARGADDAFELALSASTLLGWLGYYDQLYRDDILSWNERDAAQARNLALLMEKHGAARAILAAHSSHVSHNRSPADWWGYGDLRRGFSRGASALVDAERQQRRQVRERRRDRPAGPLRRVHFFQPVIARQGAAGPRYLAALTRKSKGGRRKAKVSRAKRARPSFAASRLPHRQPIEVNQQRDQGRGHPDAAHREPPVLGERPARQPGADGVSGPDVNPEQRVGTRA
jgi:erythromycin esterase-like protein